MKILNGTVVKIIDDQTVKVRIDTIWLHPVYKKRVKRSKNYLVHSQGIKVKAGEKVSLTDCKPVSKQKKWKIYQKDSK